MIYIKCNCCNNDSTSLLFQKQGFNIVKCNNCGLVYVNPRLSAEETEKLYQEENYFSRGDKGFGYRNYLADRELHIKTFEREFDLIGENTKNGKVLDIGCAAGFALKVAKDRGWDVHGIEISKFASEYAKKEFGIPVFHGTLENALLPENHFDLIITYGTIEHTTDPKAFLRKAAALLKNDGVIVIATPDIGSWLGNRKFQYKPLEHLYYFNRDTLSKILNDAGMEVFAFRKMKVHRSIRFLLERLKYYFTPLSFLFNFIETIAATIKVLDFSFHIHDGQMVICAKKVAR